MAQMLELLPPKWETQMEFLAPNLILVLLIVAIWAVNLQMEDLSPPLYSASVSVTLKKKKILVWAKVAWGQEHNGKLGWSWSNH